MRTAPIMAARGLRAPAGVLVAAAAVVAFVAVVDPNEQGHYPTCPFLALTGTSVRAAARCAPCTHWPTGSSPMPWR